MTERRIQIGWWIERESRVETRCPSYYAADFEKIRTRPGRYPLVLVIVTGYTIPMPYWICTSIAGDRIDGRLYSAFAGNIIGSTALPLEETTLSLQMYAYSLAKLIESGRIELDEHWKGLEVNQIEFAREHFPTWEALRTFTNTKEA